MSATRFIGMYVAGWLLVIAIPLLIVLALLAFAGAWEAVVGPLRELLYGL